jgi:hypothetical protein
MTTETASLYVHDNGEICCIDHAGSYLSSEYRHAPERHEYWTPLGTWERMDSAYINDFTRLVGRAPKCQQC